jgi:serine/threonine protein kinase
MADRAGQQLGKYRLVRLIGRGGFADVYLGEHERLGNQVAIKVLQTRLESEDIESFQQEARTVGRLAHPNIVRVYDFAVQDGTPFLAMDYAPNGTLRQRHTRGTRVPLETILLYVKQIADALNYAHEQKVVHRDIKPENMLIGPLDDILLSDFGIAVVSQSSRYQTSNEMVGTVGYMAPEQIQGQPRPASDQYSLGIVVYEWLSGERPFNGGVTEVATQHLAVPPPPLRTKVPTLSPAIEEVVMTALAKDPAQRFGSVRAFATALENAVRAEPSLTSLSTQLAAPVISPPPGTPAVPNPSAPASGLSAAPTSEVILPPANQGPASLPFAPTMSEGRQPSGQTWSDAETIRSSLPIGSQPPAGAPGVGSPSAPPVGMYASPSQPWPYGAPGVPQTPSQPSGYLPQVAPSQPSGYLPVVAPGATAPSPQTRRSPKFWLIVALLVLLGGGGGAATFVFLATPRPVISVTSSYNGARLGGPPDTVLYVSGQHFSGNSTITFLLDGAPAPGAQLAQSAGDGSFAVNLTITDDWTFDTHTLTARDARGYVTQDGVSITVIPQPVLDIQSQYHDGGTPAGSLTTSFTIAGKRFAPNTTVTFLMDGQVLPGTQPTPADPRGRAQVTVFVTSAWSLGTHTVTAQDSAGNRTRATQTLEVVSQGAAGTPGPNGAPADDATFTIFVTVQPNGYPSFTATLNVSNGRVCDNGRDTGQPQNYSYTYSNGDSYTETFTLTCSGTYKGGHITYTETDTNDSFNLSDGGYCVASTPRTSRELDGSFSSANTISGTFQSDAEILNCPRVNTFYLGSVGAVTGTWSGSL